MKTAEAVQMVARLIQDPNRIDRCLCRGEDGFYLTDSPHRIDGDGVQSSEPYVRVPGDGFLGEDAAADWAADIVRDFDELAGE